MVGDTLGVPVGEEVVGRLVGIAEGPGDGLIVGLIDGVEVVGAIDGTLVGFDDVGEAVGDELGAAEVGEDEGEVVGVE